MTEKAAIKQQNNNILKIEINCFLSSINTINRKVKTGINNSLGMPTKKSKDCIYIPDQYITNKEYAKNIKKINGQKPIGNGREKAT